MAIAADDDYEGYAEPLEIVDRTDLSYEERLSLLQGWKAVIPSDTRNEWRRTEVANAIQALEIGRPFKVMALKQFRQIMDMVLELPNKVIYRDFGRGITRLFSARVFRRF